MKPINFTFKSEVVPWIILLASFASGIYFYSQFPDTVVSHWNFEGEPDGYTGKFWGAFLGPVVLFGMYLLFLTLPHLDPKKENYKDFQTLYLYFRNMVMAVMLAIFALVGFYNLGYEVNISTAIPIIIGLMFIVMGRHLGKIKSNWFVGVRTPWTLSSEVVWEKTHAFAGKCLMAFGAIMVAMPFLTKTLSFILFFLGIALLVFGTFVYSYIAYHKIKQ